jgi:hypothetical protein
MKKSLKKGWAVTKRALEPPFLRIVREQREHHERVLTQDGEVRAFKASLAGFVAAAKTEIRRAKGEETNRRRKLKRAKAKMDLELSDKTKESTAVRRGVLAKLRKRRQLRHAAAKEKEDAAQLDAAERLARERTELRTRNIKMFSDIAESAGREAEALKLAIVEDRAAMVAEKAAAIDAAVKAKAKAETEVAELHVQHERALAASADALALVRGKWETAQLERATALRESEEATRAAAALLAVERHEHADARRQLDEALAVLTSMNEVKAAAAKQHGKSTQHEKSATARHDAAMAASAAAAVLEADLERQEHALIDSVVELREDAGDVSTMRTAVTFPPSTASRTTGTRSNATNRARMKTKAEGKQTAHASYPRPGVRERRLLSVRCRSRSKKRSSPAPSSKREPPREHEQSATDDGAKNEGDALTARTDQQKGEDEGNEITLGDSSSSDDFHLDSPSSSYDESLDDLSPRRDRPTHGTRGWK